VRDPDHATCDMIIHLLSLLPLMLQQQLLLLPVRSGGGSGGGSSGRSGGGSSGGGSGGSSGGFSGGSSGGSSSGGSAGGALIGLIVLGVFGIFALLIVFLVWRAIRKSKKARTESVSALAMDSMSTAKMQADSQDQLLYGLQLVKYADPNFDIVRFDEAARRVFYAMQTAWCERNPGLTRQITADALWQVTKQQIDSYVQRGAFNRLDGLAVQYTFIQHITIDDKQHIVVRFFVDSADYDVDSTGKVIKGKTNVASWSEDWVFTREAAAKTVVTGGIADAKCPNCGAPLAVDNLGRCDYCHAAIMGGQHDWVLFRIDQLSSLEDGWDTRGVTAEALNQGYDAWVQQQQQEQQNPLAPPPAEPPPPTDPEDPQGQQPT